MLSLSRIDALLEQFERRTVVVAGDVMLDEYLVGDVERVSPEAPVPVVRVEREIRSLGGAGNVARNFVALGAEARLVGVIGDDASGRMVADLTKSLGLQSAGLVVDAQRRTTQKTRVVARGQQLIRSDREDLLEPDEELRSALEARVGEAASGAQGATLVDYGKGVLLGACGEILRDELLSQGLRVALDPKAEILRSVDLVKPNLSEARRLISAEESLPISEVVAELRRRSRADVVVTCGRDGMWVAGDGESTPRHVPGVARDVFDVQGAGDTSLAALFLSRLCGGSLFESAIIANAAASVAVGKVGTAAVTREEVRSQVEPLLAALEETR